MSKRLPQQKPAAGSKTKSTNAPSSSTQPKKKQSVFNTPKQSTPALADKDTEENNEEFSDFPPDMMEQQSSEPETQEQLHSRLINRLLPPSSSTDALSQLTHARLDRAKLTNLECFSSIWTSANSVTHLYLQHNKLESILPGIELLPSLVFLTVAHNRLRSLAGLSNAAPALRFLDASHNDLTKIDPAADLPANLLILCLQGNPCHGYRRAVLARLHGLRQLDLRIVDQSGSGGDSERLPTDSEDEDEDAEDQADDDIARMLRVARQCLGESESEDDNEADAEDEESHLAEGQAEAGDAAEASVRSLAADILMRSQSRLEAMMSADSAGDGGETERRRRLLAASIGELKNED